MKTFSKTVAFMAVLAMAGMSPAWGAGPVTFTKDILPIMQEECQTCHRPAGTNLSGMIAPMSLMTYEEVRPWAKAIIRAVESKSMPPWHASEEFNGVFHNERTLTEEQVATIRTWIEQGAKRGNPQDAPEPTEWSETGWSFGEPNLVVDFPEPYFVADEVEDLYHDIYSEISEEKLPNDRWISGIEFKPGSDVVHHIIGHAYAPGQAKVESAGMLGGNAPGADASAYPDGFGIELKKGSTIKFAMHYHKESGAGTGTWDASQIGMTFHDEDRAIEHPVTITTVDHGAFEIPPMHDNWRVGGAEIIEEDIYLISMLPHMHLRGKSARYTAFYPDGTSEELLDVPAYDFNWQTGYGYEVMKKIPAGTRLEMEMYYDNSQEKGQAIGFNATRPVSFGGPTTDEMDLAWITYAPVAPVDMSSNQKTERAGD